MNFRGQRRTNDTHESSTDPEARSARKGPGKEAKLSYAGHALMENRNGLCVDLQIRSAIIPESVAAEALLDRQHRKRVRPKSLSGDKGYYIRGFIKSLRDRGIHPHIARIEGGRTPGLDARATRHESYRISQRKRKRIEEIFGWLKTYGGLRKTRFIGSARVQLQAYLAGAAYNLLRMSRLRLSTG